MKQFIYDAYNVIMNANINPLRNIPDTSTRLTILCILSVIWSIAFATFFGSIVVFGITAVAHIAILIAIGITVVTFEAATRDPSFFIRRDGYHTMTRCRQNLWVNGKRVDLDPNDAGGEHE